MTDTHSEVPYEAPKAEELDTEHLPAEAATGASF